MANLRAIRYSSCEIKNGVAPSTYRRQSSDLRQPKQVSRTKDVRGAFTSNVAIPSSCHVGVARKQAAEGDSRAKRSLRDRFSKRESNSTILRDHDTSAAIPSTSCARPPAAGPPAITQWSTESISIDVARAISLLQSLRISATPAEIRALHRALLPTPGDEALYCSVDRKADPVRPYNAGRRRSDLPASVATRISPGKGSLRRLEHPALREQAPIAATNTSDENTTPLPRSRDSIVALDLAGVAVQAQKLAIATGTIPISLDVVSCGFVDKDSRTSLNRSTPISSNERPELRTWKSADQRFSLLPRIESMHERQVATLAHNGQTTVDDEHVITKKSKTKPSRFKQRWNHRAIHLSREYTSECLPVNLYDKNDATSSHTAVSNIVSKTTDASGATPLVETPAWALSLWEQTTIGGQIPSIDVHPIASDRNIDKIRNHANKTDSGYASRLSNQSLNACRGDLGEDMGPKVLDSFTHNTIVDDTPLCTLAEMLKSSEPDQQHGAVHDARSSTTMRNARSGPEGKCSPSTMFERLMIDHAESPPSLPDIEYEDFPSRAPKASIESRPSTAPTTGESTVDVRPNHTRTKSATAHMQNTRDEVVKKKFASTRVRRRTIGSYITAKSNKNRLSLSQQSAGNMPITSSAEARPSSLANFGFPMSVPNVPAETSQRPLSIQSRRVLVRVKNSQGMSETDASEFARLRSRDAAGTNLISAFDIPRIAVPNGTMQSVSGSTEKAKRSDNGSPFSPENNHVGKAGSLSSDAGSTNPVSEIVPPMPNIPSHVISRASRAEEKALRRLQHSSLSSPEFSSDSSMDLSSKLSLTKDEIAEPTDGTHLPNAPSDDHHDHAPSTKASMIGSPRSLSSAQWEQEAREWRERRKSAASNRARNLTDCAAQANASVLRSDSLHSSSASVPQDIGRLPPSRVRAFHRPMPPAGTPRTLPRKELCGFEPSQDLPRCDSSNSAETFYSATSQSGAQLQDDERTSRNISPVTGSPISSINNYCVSPLVSWARSPEGALAALEGNVSPNSSVNDFQLGEARLAMHKPASMLTATPRSPRICEAKLMFDRYSGGLDYNWDRKSGFTSSAGTSLSQRKYSPQTFPSGLDLRDVPQLAARTT